MATVFFDTSALAKRYLITESGAERVQALFADPDLVALIARVTTVEIASAFGRRLREGQMDPSAHQSVWGTFRAHLANHYSVVEPDVSIWDEAVRLCIDYPLMAYDAVQLSTALGVARMVEAGRDELQFCTADRRQADVAIREGLAVEPIV